MSILANSNAIESGGYNISNSLRFRASASAYLSRTPASASNQKTWTWSGWVKRGALSSSTGAGQHFGITASSSSANNPRTEFNFQVDDTIRIGFNPTGTTWYESYTTAVFRDPSAWYHIVVAVDTTQATSGNRLKVYVNGVQQTLGTYSVPAQNTDVVINSANVHNIGRYASGADSYFDGYQTEINFIDGQALTPSSFGSTNSITGVWQPAKYTGTYGTNGFYLPFNNANSASGFSNYYAGFDGSTQYLTTPNGSQYAFGTGDFTVESWVYLDSNVAYTTIATTSQAGSGAGGVWILEFSQTRGLFFNNYGSSGFYPQFNQWYHVAVARQSGTLRFFVNGQLILSGSDTTNYSATTGDLGIGGYPSYSGYRMPGKMSNFRIVKGTAVYTSNFTPPSTLTAISGTSLLTLQNSTIIDNSGSSRTITNYNSVTMTSATIGNYNTVTNDYSGNGNNWINNYINVVTSGTTYDWMTDVPTLTSATAANYCTLNPAISSTTNLINANLTRNGAVRTNVGTIPLTNGKYYFETTIQDSNGNGGVGVKQTTAYPLESYDTSKGATYFANGEYKIEGGAQTSGFSTYTNGDVIGIAVDTTQSPAKIWFAKNNTWQGTGNPTTSGYSLTAGLDYLFAILHTSGSSSTTASANFGQQGFTYTPPTGYVALNTYNLPTPTIVKGNMYMDATAYTGTNGSPTTQVISSNFKPDFLWFKKRSSAYDHALIDSVRGINKQLYSNLTNAEGTDTDVLTAIGSSSFTVGNSNYSNYGTLVAWTWQAGQGTTSSNTSGSITSTVSVNATAGFSIVTYTGTGANATVGHGLGVTPAMYIVKRRNGTANNWRVYHRNMAASPATGTLYLSLTDAFTVDSTEWNNTAPTSSVISLGTQNSVNGSGGTFVAYCWAEIAGFSKFGSYTGNGSADGPFVYLGFRPKYIMFKNATYAGTGWRIFDSSRSAANVAVERLWAHSSSAELTSSAIDLLSNGFKIRDGSLGDYFDYNKSGDTFIYIAFAENPAKYSLAR